MTTITRSEGTQSFTYDFCNQMVSATDKTGAGGKEFSYDAEGRLVAENVVGETAERKYLYEGGNIILEKNTDGTETRNLYGHGLLLREEGKSTSAEIIAKHSLEIQYGEKKYYQGDGTGNVTGYLKGNGEEEARYEYYAFGQERKKEGETENPYQYAGARYDETVGMYYMEGSWYYPESGQYINGQRGNESLTRYAYRENNPLNYADYSGFAPVRPTEEPEKAATNTGWRLQLGMIVENDTYITILNYSRINLEPTVVLDGYSQRIILEQGIVRLRQEEERRRRLAEKAWMEQQSGIHATGSSGNQVEILLEKYQVNLNDQLEEKNMDSYKFQDLNENAYDIYIEYRNAYSKMNKAIEKIEKAKMNFDKGAEEAAIKEFAENAAIVQAYIKNGIKILDVPLYNQTISSGSSKLCWLYASMMIRDYYKGIDRTDEKYWLVFEELDKFIHDYVYKYNQGGYFMSSSNPIIFDSSDLITAIEKIEEENNIKLTKDFSPTKNSQKVHASILDQDTLISRINLGEPIAVDRQTADKAFRHLVVVVGYIKAEQNTIVIYNDPGGYINAEYLNDFNNGTWITKNIFY